MSNTWHVELTSGATGDKNSSTRIEADAEPQLIDDGRFLRFTKGNEVAALIPAGCVVYIKRVDVAAAASS